MQPFPHPPSLPRPHILPWHLDRSAALLERARGSVAGLTLSMMKRPEHFAPGSFPVYLARGHGALVEDVDGNEYVDFVSGLGANTLGHGHPALVSAAKSALEAGFLHSLPAPLEVECAEALLATLPNAEMVRFFKTGADATSAAVRLARAISGKEKIFTIGYNGWHDHFMFDTPGVPAALSSLTTRLPLFRPEDEGPVLEAIRKESAELAAVLLSLPYGRVISREFLVELRSLCTERGVLLVFDEIVTGLRIALGGAAEFYDVQADFSCFSKALAAGMPLSALVGPRRHLEVMERLQVSTTFGGELLSLAVCRAALGVYRETNYIEHLAALGRQLREGVNRVAEELDSSLRVLGYDAIPFFFSHPEPARNGAFLKELQGQMAERGVLLRRDVNFISGAHTAEQIDFTVDAVRQSLVALRDRGLAI